MMNQHCSLRTLDDLDAEDRNTWVSARKHIFNWLPFDGTQLKNADGKTALELVVGKGSKVDESVDEFTWRCGMTDDNQLRIAVHASCEAFEKRELEDIVEQVFFFIDKLADAENWNGEVGRVIPLNVNYG